LAYVGKGDLFVGSGSTLCRSSRSVMSWEFFLSPLGWLFVGVGGDFVGCTATHHLFREHIMSVWDYLLSVLGLHYVGHKIKFNIGN